jgi:hypothetical protein
MIHDANTPRVHPISSRLIRCKLLAIEISSQPIHSLRFDFLFRVREHSLIKINGENFFHVSRIDIKYDIVFVKIGGNLKVRDSVRISF